VCFTFSSPGKHCFRRDRLYRSKEVERGANIEFSINAGYMNLRKS
jgi:hypothetical protein